MWVDQDVPNDQPRKLYFHGLKEHIDIAVDLVNDLLKTAPVFANASSPFIGGHGGNCDVHTVIVDCPAEQVGLLIGRKGWVIKKFMQESGAQITINQSVREGHPRKIIISGRKESVAIAEHYIKDILYSKQLEIQMKQNYNHMMGSNHTASASGSASVSSLSSPTLPPGAASGLSMVTSGMHTSSPSLMTAASNAMVTQTPSPAALLQQQQQSLRATNSMLSYATGVPAHSLSDTSSSGSFTSLNSTTTPTSGPGGSTYIPTSSMGLPSGNSSLSQAPPGSAATSGTGSGSIASALSMINRLSAAANMNGNTAAAVASMPLNSLLAQGVTGGHSSEDVPMMFPHNMSSSESQRVGGNDFHMASFLQQTGVSVPPDHGLLSHSMNGLLTTTGSGGMTAGTTGTSFGDGISSHASLSPLMSLSHSHNGISSHASLSPPHSELFDYFHTAPAMSSAASASTSSSSSTTSSGLMHFDGSVSSGGLPSAMHLNNSAAVALSGVAVGGDTSSTGLHGPLSVHGIASMDHQHHPFPAGAATADSSSLLELLSSQSLNAASMQHSDLSLHGFYGSSTGNSSGVNGVTAADTPMQLLHQQQQRFGQYDNATGGSMSSSVHTNAIASTFSALSLDSSHSHHHLHRTQQHTHHFSSETNNDQSSLFY